MNLRNEILYNKCTYKALSFILIFGVLIFVITTQYYGYDDDEIYIIDWKLTNDISCHRKNYGDSLLRLESNFTPPQKSIFMHETSCRGGLNSRQACAVESAARAHPDWHVHMLFSGPVSSYALRRSCLAKLLRYGNVRLFRIQLEEYAKGTPVQSLVETSPFEKTTWKVEHTSDVLRYLTLYKFGGVYMDSDVIVVKSFDTLASNWAARESGYAVDSGLMSLSRDALGRQVAEACIQDFKQNYNPKKWGNNGPGVITRVVKKMCHSENNTGWIKGCNGFKIYDPIVFYPVYYKQNKKYFEANRNLTTSDKTYAHHMWNALTRDYEVPKTSPYAKLAKEYCPTVYEMYGDKFGA